MLKKFTIGVAFLALTLVLFVASGGVTSIHETPLVFKPTEETRAIQSLAQDAASKISSGNSEAAPPQKATTTKKLTAPIKEKTEETAAQGGAIPVAEKIPVPLPLAELNTRVRAAVVNILCTTKQGGSFKPITGSGVIIDPRGVILTNAHVAQYFLLQNYRDQDFVSCIIRNGDMAQPAYKARLLFIPPAWILSNAADITKEHPLGTGEHDYALLLVTESTREGENLPEQFPYVPMDVTLSSVLPQNPVLLASYPAELLDGISIQKDLSLVSTTALLGQFYTFAKEAGGPIDLFSLGGTIVAQGGSSGGAVVNRYTGELIGIIVISTKGATTGEKDLRALSLGHINRNIFEQLEITLPEFLAHDPSLTADAFRDKYFEVLKNRLAASLEN